MLETRPARRSRAAPRFGDLLALTRPLHAVKSVLLVPVALIDTPSWTAHELGAIGWAVVVFSLAAACVYVANDIIDRDRDRRHPVKRHRPVAAGQVSVRAGMLYCATLLTLLGVLVATAPGGPYWPVLGYLALNLAYVRGLKHVPLLDIGTVAIGFVLRVVQGYVSVGRPVSAWLVVAVLSVSLLLLIGKRRHELTAAGLAHRPALRGYSPELINQLLPITGMLAVVAGLIYLSSDALLGAYHRVAVLLSAPFALFLLFRYLQVLVVRQGGGDPLRMMLRDRVMVVAVALWFGGLAVLLMLARSAVMAS
ncbi:UbiA prenyltransferase family protein [Actinocrispum sp. NPDC049592]|uniref:UbiA prenyltransferase family protein n=1 Tax=Actinocrispum sp. NPDC049592 TaxID=3154835 RepID=UPI00342E335D